MNHEIILDGSQGEGGGQILRSSLTLSMVTGRAFRIHAIRAGRKKPGLMRQHLTCVRAAARVCSAEVKGAELGSRTLTFRPGPIVPGQYSFSVGSAGSSTLVFQTLLPALMTMGQSFELTLAGGTHNPSAPTLDFLDHVYLAALRSMGVEAVIKLDRRGFFPNGGGKWSVVVSPPAKLLPLRILERGTLMSQNATVLWNRIPSAEPQRARKHLLDSLGWDPADIKIEEAVDSLGPANVIMAEFRYERITEMLTAFNPYGASPEAMCDGLLLDIHRYKENGAPVGWRLADQLLLPMSLGAGGMFRTLPLSSHSKTNIETIGRFLERKIEVRDIGRRVVEVGVAPI